MAHHSPHDDDSDEELPASDGSTTPRDPESGRSIRDLTDSQVHEAFAQLANEFSRDHLNGPRDYSVEDVVEEFIPPDPGPVTSSDPFLTAGWFLLAGGLFVLLGSLMVWPAAPRIFHLACLGAVLVGGALLVWRMPQHKDDDDDLGAVV